MNKKNKLLILLNTFSKVERKHFRDFVQSPYYNKQQAVSNLANHLLELDLKKVNKTCLELENLPSDILSLEKRNLKELSYVKSELYRLAKQFVAIQNLNKQKDTMAYYTAQAMISRDKTTAQKILTKLYKGFTKYSQESHQDMLMRFLVIELLREHSPKEDKMSERLLQSSIDTLERYYLLNKVSQGWEIENRRLTVKHTDDFRNPLMDAIEDYLSDQDKLDPLTAIYFQLYLTTKNTGEEFFNDLLKVIRKNSNIIDQVELRNIYLATINISIRRMRKQPERYAVITLDLYVEGIRNETLFIDGVLSEWTFKNIVRYGIYLKRFFWVEKFISDHLVYLSPKDRDNTYYSNSAELAFARSEYDLALELINNLRTNNFRYYLGVKILRIKIFYEKNDMVAFESNLSTFSVYLLRRKELAYEVRVTCQNFCSILQRILKMTTERKKKKTAEKINNTQPLTEKEWLLSVFKRESKRIYT